MKVIDEQNIPEITVRKCIIQLINFVLQNCSLLHLPEKVRLVHQD